MSQKPEKNQDEIAVLVDTLSLDTLEELKKGNNDVNIEPLIEAIQIYSSFPEYYTPSLIIWKERLAEITDILRANYTKAQAELQQLVENNAKMRTYDKNQDAKEE